MKNKELFDLLGALNNVGELSGVKFAYAVGKNKKTLTAETETLKEAIAPTDLFQEYEGKVREIFLSLCAKDENGQPLNRIDINNVEEYNAKIKELEAENTEIVAQRKEQVDQFNELLEAEVSADIKLHKVKLEYVPEDITAKQMEGVMPIVDDD